MATDYVVRFTGQDNLSGTINDVKQKLQEVGSATSEVDKIAQKFNKIQNSTAPLRRKLKDVQLLLADMDYSGLRDEAGQIFIEMAEQAGEYKAALDAARDSTAAFSDPFLGVKSNIAVFEGLAASVSIAQGAMGLMGIESEKVEQALLKVQSVQAVLNGVQSIANLLDADSVLMIKAKQIAMYAKAAATKVDTAATSANSAAVGVNTGMTVASTTAQKAWNVVKAVSKALLGDFSGLILVGAVALGTYALATSDSADELEKQANATDKAKEAQNKFNSDLASSAGQLVGKYKLLQNEWRNLKSVADKKQWIKDNATEFKNLGLKVTDLKSAEDIFVNNTPNVITALKARASAMAAQSMLTEAYTEYYKKIMEADNTVAGGGYYNVYSGSGKGWTSAPYITEEMKAAGVTAADFNQKTVTKRSGSMVYDTTEYQELQKVIDKVNAYRIQQANKTNKTVKAQAQKDLDKVVNFATSKINEANGIIAANGLDFSQGSGGSGSSGGSSSSVNSTTTQNKPDTPTYEIGSLADLEAQYKKLENELKNTNVSPERLQQINAEKEALQQQIETLKIRNGLLEPKETLSPEQLKRNSYTEAKTQINQIEDDLQMGIILDVAEAEKQIAEINKKLVDLGLTPIPVKLTATEIEKKRTAYQNAEQQVQQLQADYKLKIINADQAKEQLATINQQLEELGLKKIELYVNSKGLETATEAVETFKSNMDSVASAVGSFGNCFSSLSEAIGGTGGAMLEMAGQTMQAVAQIIPQIVALIGAKQGEALASGTASAAGLPFPANIAAIASIIATITALFASFSGKFADGGIVSGSSFHGDKLLARVNAGEMILNQKQQSNLFNQLNSNSSNIANGKVIFKIQGKELVGVLSNYNSKLNKLR